MGNSVPITNAMTVGNKAERTRVCHLFVRLAVQYKPVFPTIRFVFNVENTPGKIKQLVIECKPFALDSVLCEPFLQGSFQGLTAWEVAQEHNWMVMKCLSLSQPTLHIECEPDFNRAIFLDLHEIDMSCVGHKITQVVYRQRCAYADP